MKNFFVCSVAAVMGFVCLVSCSEQESDLPSTSHQLRIVTHTREGEAPLARVYLFNADNTLARTIQTDDAGSYTSASASVKLPSATYTLCALNASDLAHFQIPDNPTPTSVITKATGQSMGDLLMATASATLPDGASEVVDMTLQRKVLELSTLSVSQVPADVTGVSVSITPFYSGIQFNGTYVATDPVTCTFNLVASTITTGLWELTPEQLVFPSKDKPAITVTFTRGDNDASTYTYTASEAMTANNKYNISGVYTEPLGVTITGTITLQPWPTDPAPVNFDFDEQNNSANNSGNNNQNDPNNPSSDPSTNPTTDPSEVPVAGKTYKGCYVVSVDETNRKAVLLSPTEGSGYSTKVDKSNKGWATYLQDELQSWPSVEGITGKWRFPTLAEVEKYTGLPNVINLTSVPYCIFFFDNSAIKFARIYYDNNQNIAVKGLNTPPGLSDTDILRPVIDITY